jgi:hypothetical protein
MHVIHLNPVFLHLSSSATHEAMFVLVLRVCVPGRRVPLNIPGSRQELQRQKWRHRGTNVVTCSPVMSCRDAGTAQREAHHMSYISEPAYHLSALDFVYHDGAGDSCCMSVHCTSHAILMMMQTRVLEQGRHGMSPAQCWFHAAHVGIRYVR